MKSAGRPVSSRKTVGFFFSSAHHCEAVEDLLLLLPVGVCMCRSPPLAIPVRVAHSWADQVHLGNKSKSIDKGVSGGPGIHYLGAW